MKCSASGGARAGPPRGGLLPRTPPPPPPLAADLVRQPEAADQAVAEEVLHLDRRDQVDDAGRPPAVLLLALVQHRGNLVDLIERALAAGQAVGDAFAQDVAEGAVEGVGREQIGDWAREHDDVLGGLLDLPHALEIAHRRRDVFDADAEQGRHRHREQLRELLQRLDFRQLALLEAIERGARDPEPARDLVGAQPRSQAKGLEAVADIVEANGHE
jgi:hypothetical protein